MSSLVGARVVRGPDWEWGDQDAGEGHVGTVLSIGQGQLVDRPEKTVMVMWDHGKRNNYRAGFNNRFDLRIFDNAQTGVTHLGMSCISCNEGIHGIRWQCFRCFACNLCNLCFMNGSHEIGHDFQRFVNVDSAGTRLYNRGRSRQVEAKGLFAGAQVQRGNDWRYGDQDGGDSGRLGHVIDVRGWQDKCNRAAVAVRWPHKSSDKLYRYRVGYEGKVDIKCVASGHRGTYYPDLLPNLGEKDGLCVGDTVILSITKDTIKSFKDAERPLPVHPEQPAGSKGQAKGVVKNVTGKGEVNIEFDGRQLMQVNPIAVQKVAAFKVGDKVNIIKDQSEIEKLQRGHGGWNSSMEKIVGKEGKVEQIYSDGDIKVRIGGSRLLFNPECLILVESDQQEEKFEQSPEDGIRSLTRQLSAQSMKTDDSEKRRLSRAAALGRTTETREFLATHPHLIDSTYSGRTPLQVAAHQGQLEVIRELMKHHPALEIRDGDGDTALLYATYGNQPEVVQYLIRSGCHVNVVNRQKRSCLHVAARRGLLQCVQLLLKGGCNCNIQDKAGEVALHDAIHKDKRDVIQYLVQWPQSDLTIPNNKGLPPLHYASLRGTTYAVQCLVTHHPRLVMHNNHEGKTPLHVATSNNFEDVAQILIKQGKCDVNSYDNNHVTPLHMAIDGGYTRLIGLLVTSGADINAQDGVGDTCLHVAATRAKHSSYGKEASAFVQHCQGISDAVLKIPGVPLLVYLIQRGASVDQRNKAGKTPLDLLENPVLAGDMMQVAKQAKNLHNAEYCSRVPPNLGCSADSVSQVCNLDYERMDRPIEHIYCSILGEQVAAPTKEPQPQQERRLPPHPARPALPALPRDMPDGKNVVSPATPIAADPSKAHAKEATPVAGSPVVDPVFEGVHRIEVKEIELQQCIAKGSFAEVYRGRWRGTTVAVKKMPLAGSKYSDVEQEVAIHKRAMHPNIVQLMALGYDKVFAFLIMSFINGQTLHAAIFPEKETCILTKPEKNVIARDVLSALTFMHASGLLHLDIKPTNILLEKRTLKPYLCDLGLSYAKRRAVMNQSSHLGQMRGTPMYMAPEMHEGTVKVTWAQDMWSLACTFLEMFSECTVYPPTLTMWGLMRSFMEGNVVPKSLAKLAQPYRAILGPCFSKEPRQRPTASNLLDTFTELCEDDSAS